MHLFHELKKIENQFDVTKFTDFLQNLLPGRIAGLWHTENDNVADRAKIENGESKLLYGEEKIEENINNLRFEISLESVIQTNPR
jgi:hypothetical protein